MRQKLKIALAQIACRPGDKSENLRLLGKMAAKAQKQSADLIVFPELSLTGYVVRDQIYELAEPIPGPSTSIIENIAQRTGTHIVFGMPELSERTQATIYNSSVLIGPKGIVGKYRKMYLPTHSVFEEKRYFRPGHEVTVCTTELGKIGLIVCYDIFFPEVCRLVRLKGAQLIICISASPAVRRSFFETLTTARALENTAFLAFVNLVGIEDGLQFWGGSRLIGPQGKVLIEARYDEPDLVVGEIDYSDIRPIEAFVPTLRDLRPELFEKLRKSSEEL